MAEKKKPVYKILAESEPINYSPALEREYRMELRKFVDRMIKETKKVLLTAYSKNENKFDFATDSAGSLIDKDLAELTKKYRDLFSQHAEDIAYKMFMKQFKYAKLKFWKIIEKLIPNAPKGGRPSTAIKGSILTKEMFPTYKAAIEENVGLIKSIPDKYFEQVTGSVTRSMQFGGSLKQLEKEINRFSIMTDKRAGFIAGDQTRKAFSSINLRNFQRTGIQKVKWVHSGGGQDPRDYHLRKWDGVSGIKDGRPNGLNGFIFDIDKPPVIQFETKSQPEVRGYPAQLPNCKCVMTAVIVLEE